MEWSVLNSVRIKWGAVLAAALSLLAGAAIAGDGPAFSFPLACAVGKDCWILQYPDRDPGPQPADYACGKRTYDGHTGTDIFIGHTGRIAGDVAVVAAAPGVVANFRDGMADALQAPGTAKALDETACGNAVVLDHGDGWRTAYCHLKRGSVAVAPGATVARGQRLGAVGLSGMTEMPHLEFLVLKDLKPVDPFVGPGGEQGPGQGCGLGQGHLWDAAALGAVAYRPIDVWRLGFVEKQPDPNALFAPVDLTRQAPAGTFPLFVLVDLLGVRAGDGATIEVAGPRGPVARQSVTFPRDNIASRVALPLGRHPWWPGSYTLRVSLARPASGFTGAATAEMVLR